MALYDDIFLLQLIQSATSLFQVRDQAQQLLLKLMMPASTPQYVFERIMGTFTHKLWHVREGVLICLQNTINR